MPHNRSSANLPIRYKIFLTCVAVVMPFALITGLVSYSVMKKSLQGQMISELSNTTEVVRNMVETSVRLSVMNYLRSSSESNRDIVALVYERYKNGELTEDQAKREASKLLLGQSIGETGYLYCVNSRAIATVHPSPEVAGVDFSDQSFVREQVRRKEGYLEYDWQNPGESSPRAKALYMSYFEPWDWIISATAYRGEYASLLNSKDFRQSVGSLKFGKSGYSFILDIRGNFIVHPALQGVNAFEMAFTGEGDFINNLIKERRGQQFYEWKNPGEAEARQKVVVYDFVPETGWIVASTAYLEDLYEPLEAIRERSIVAGMLCLLIGIFVAMRVSVSITDPIRRLVNRLSKEGVSKYSLDLDEVSQLSAHFDRFLEDLEQEARERQETEQKLRASQERYRAVMEAAPDPIMLVGLKGEVTYLNKAFIRIFGWTLEDFEGSQASPFIPADDKQRSRYLLRRLLGGEVIAGEDALRVTRDGKELTVNMSGGPFSDSAGTLNGCVLILRDVSELKELERRVIEADERERIRIGQDLHDDLVPHPIGLEVMCKLLRRRLGEDISEAQKQADKVQHILAEAIKKTRALSRGLSPVHLVEDGLEMSMRQLAEMVELVFAKPCKVDWAGEVELETTTAVHVYRIVQEALHNAVKHSNAESLSVKCDGTGEAVVFEVQDNGTGLNENLDKRGMGLKIMAFRAQMIGGSIDVSKRSDGGTAVRLTLRQGC